MSVDRFPSNFKKREPPRNDDTKKNRYREAFPDRKNGPDRQASRYFSQQIDTGYFSFLLNIKRKIPA
ncbi:MAG: hypothetical protein WBA74_20280 [Cyclobacteriaceae bacterium]